MKIKEIKEILKRLIGKEGTPWQVKRNTQIKSDTVKKILEETGTDSVLDVGCNAGEITRHLGKEGYFAVGIDKKLDFRGIAEPLNGVCLGQIEFDINLVNKLPQFDAILLLSVHHQMVKNMGDEWTKQFVSKLATKSKKVLVIEFAAVNSRYGRIEGELFRDNDEKSIVTYADGWLKTVLPNFKCFYVTKIPEKKGVVDGPYRILFKCLPIS